MKNCGAMKIVPAAAMLGVLMVAGCADKECKQCSVTRTQTAPPQAVKPAEPQYLDAENGPSGANWIPLIAADLSGWHPRSTDRPNTWSVVDGILTNTLASGQHGVDIISDSKFKDFELYYEYRISKGSNSGMYLRGRYEIQILDDADRPLNKGSNGALYGVAAPSRNVSRPAGQWQSVRAKIAGNRITVVSNGVKVLDNVEASGPTGGALDDKVDEPGPIMIQGDHGPIEVRRLMIHPLNSAS
jgi:hypothetical protein